jgi:signal transduction histidine kinase
MAFTVNGRSRNQGMHSMSSTEWQYKYARALHMQHLRTLDILQTSLSLSGEAVGAASGCITLFDAGGTLTQAFLLGTTNADAVRDLWQRLITHGVIAFAHYGGRGIVIEHNGSDTRWLQTAQPSPLFADGSSIAVPIRYHDQRYGVIALAHEEMRYFGSEALDLLSSFAEMTAIALYNASLLETVHTREAGFRRLAERVQQERQERQMHEKLQHDLAAMTYHDLRGPLQNIQTSLSGLERVIARGNTALIGDFIGIASNSTRQMSRMVKGLLDIERMEQGRSIVNRSRVLVDQLAGEAVAQLQALAADAEQTLFYIANPDLPQLNIDQDMIARVIANLVENAIKHTPPNGQIAVSAHLEPARTADDAVTESVVFRVADDGPGIPAHLVDQIFDKFVRVRYQNAPTGVGLGLAFCRLAVEAHGGRIWVESVEGQGATFIFTLPLLGNQLPADTAPLTQATDPVPDPAGTHDTGTHRVVSPGTASGGYPVDLAQR